MSETFVLLVEKASKFVDVKWLTKTGLMHQMTVVIGTTNQCDLIKRARNSHARARQSVDGGLTQKSGLGSLGVCARKVIVVFFGCYFRIYDVIVRLIRQFTQSLGSSSRPQKSGGSTVTTTTSITTRTTRTWTAKRRLHSIQNTSKQAYTTVTGSSGAHSTPPEGN